MKKVFSGVNVDKLHTELNNAGIKTKAVFDLGEGNCEILFNDTIDAKLVQQIVDAHNPTPLLQSPTLEEQLAERDRQISELKLNQIATNHALDNNSLQQQELLELLIDMGVI